LSPELLSVLAIIALLMVVFLSALAYKSVTVDTGIDSLVVILLLGMMIGMLIGPAYLYLTTLALTVGDIVVWEIAVFSAVGMMPIIALVSMKFVMQNDADRTEPLPFTGLLQHTATLRTIYVGLLVLSEILMGWTFNIASGLVTLLNGYSVSDVVRELSYSITTYWFVFTMVAEMFLTIFALRRSISRRMFQLLGLQALVMLLTPTALPSQAWKTYSFYLEAALMATVVAFAVLYLRDQERQKTVSDYLVFFIVANALMMAGLLWWLVSGEVLLLAPILVIQTIGYFDAVLTFACLGRH
jgi:hypothetical protein